MHFIRHSWNSHVFTNKLTCYHSISFKGKYTDKKLRAFLETDAKARGIKQSKGRKGAMITDGQGVQKEAIQRVFNYLSYLLNSIREEEEGTTRKKIENLQRLLTSQNKKVLASLQQRETEGLTKIPPLLAAHLYIAGI